MGVGDRLFDFRSKVYIFTRFVFIHFVCTFYINILGNKIDLEIPRGIAATRSRKGRIGKIGHVYFYAHVNSEFVNLKPGKWVIIMGSQTA